MLPCEWDSVVHIATHDELDGPGLESRLGRNFLSTRQARPWGPPSLSYNKYRLSFTAEKRPGRGVDYPPSSSAEVTGRSDLYLHSPVNLRSLFQDEY